MRRRKSAEVPARLLQLKRKFVEWRKARVPGERIPDRLWKSAARLAVDYGIAPTARVLTLDYYSLRKRVDEQAGAKATPREVFVELPTAGIVQVNECVIELEDGAGASMRMQLKGTHLPDVLALGRSFWSVE
jgi:hypothetical protein